MIIFFKSVILSWKQQLIYDLVRLAVCLPVVGVSLEVYSILKHLCDFVSVHFEFE